MDKRSEARIKARQEWLSQLRVAVAQQRKTLASQTKPNKMAVRYVDDVGTLLGYISTLTAKINKLEKS